MSTDRGRIKSISRRFSYTLIGVVTLLLVAFAIVSIFYIWNKNKSDLKARLRKTIIQSVITLHDPLWNINDTVVKNYLNDLKLDEDIEYIVIWEKEGDYDFKDIKIIPEKTKVHDKKKLKGSFNEYIKNNIKYRSGEEIEKIFKEHNIQHIKFIEAINNPTIRFHLSDVIEKSNYIYNISGLSRSDRRWDFSTQIVMSKARMNEEVWRQIIGIIGLSIIIMIAIIVTSLGITKKYISSPLKKLQDSAASIAEGNFDTVVDQSSRDEIGRLAHYLDNMRGKLKESFGGLEKYSRTLEEKVEELKALEEVSQAVNSILKEETVLTSIVRHAVQLSKSDAGTIYKFDENKQVFVPVINQGVSEEFVKALTGVVKVGDLTVLGQAAQKQAPDQVPDLKDRPDYPFLSHLEQEGIQAVMAVPLLLEETLIGGLVIRRKTAGEFSEPEVNLLQTLAAQSVTSIRNARLFKEKEDLLKEKDDLLAQQRDQASQLEGTQKILEDMKVRESERVQELGCFLPPQLVKMIGKDRSLLESHRKEITVVFSDLPGFTALSEIEEPEEVIEVLQRYHKAMGPVILEFEGTPKRFAGARLMVVFNDLIECDDPEVRAIKMAVKMRERSEDLRRKWERHNIQLGFKVGIAQGYATLGKIGFEGCFDYAAIGIAVNQASSLCDEAKASQILISSRVYGAVQEMVVVEPLGELSLKGLREAVTTYNVLSLKNELTAV